MNREALLFAAKALDVPPEELAEIKTLKQGMTNRSFLLSSRGMHYILRVPGEGTDKLIDRKQEAAVYHLFHGRNISDDVIAMDPERGYKLTVFWEDAHVCDPRNEDDVRLCMQALRAFHDLQLQTEKTFDLFEQIDFYESLYGVSRYEDYLVVKGRVLALRPYLNRYAKPYALTHIDSVPDNFLFTGDGVRLIDWEYAAMQDTDVDLAMFAIYAGYGISELDGLLAAYYTEGYPPEIRAKVFAYAAVCGLLWSNWCEYKHSLGVTFGDYARRQYAYASHFAPLAMKLFLDLEG